MHPPRREIIVGVLALPILAAAVSRLASESLTLSTYYPSPLGVYRSLITTGTGPTNTLLARDQGDVGIGTANPSALLDIWGRGNGTVVRITGANGDLGLGESTQNRFGWSSTFQNTDSNGYGLYSVAPYYGLYANSTANGSVAAFDFAGGNGSIGAYDFASGNGSIGTYGAATGNGGYGVIGYGDWTGVYGYGVQSYGVYGYSAGAGSSGVYGSESGSNGNGVYGYVTGANDVAVRGANAGSGWSGSFTGGSGLYADRIFSSSNDLPMLSGYYNTGDGMFFSGVWKPACPAGWNPMIAVQLDNTFLSGSFGTFQSGDWMGAAVWDTGGGWFAIWASVCPAAYPDGSGWVAGCQTSPRHASPLGVWYHTYCSATSSFRRYGGCLTAGNC